MKLYNVSRVKGGSCSKVGGIFTPSMPHMKGAGKSVYKVQKIEENVASVPIQSQPQLDMSRLAQVLAQTSVAKRGGARKVRL